MGGKNLARWAPLSGIVFVLLWIAVFLVRLVEDAGDSDAEIVSYYADSANRDRETSSSFLMFAAGLFFLVFLTVLRGRLARAEGSSGPYTALGFGAGVVGSALWLVAAVFFMAISYTIDETPAFTLDPNVYRLVSEMGYLIWVFGTAVVTLLVLVTSLLGLKAGVVPKWLAWLGLLLGVAMLLTALFVGFLIFLGWVLIVSVVLLVRPAEDEARVMPG